MGEVMVASYLLGIDAGTSVIKVALIDRMGHEYATAGRPTDILTPQLSYSEARLEDFWELTADAISEVLSQSGVTGEQVAGIGLTGNMVGAWLIDDLGQPVRDAVLWNDGRTLELMQRLSVEQSGFMSTIFASSGSVMQPGCTLPIIRWLADNEPDTLEQAAHVLCCKDWLRYKLTGQIFTDVTEASVMPGDIRNRNYSEAMFDWLGVSNYRHLFPPVVPSEQVCGTVSAEAAQRTGLKVGTPVVAGAGDVPASAIGAGAVEAGVACVILGTTCLSCLVVPQPTFTPPDVGLLFCVPGDNWLRVMANIAGTTNLDWFIGEWLGEAEASPEVFASIEQAVSTRPAGANGVIYHPYLSPVGVIAPFVASGARAQFAGLLPHHKRGDLLRAIYEGVALAIRDCYAAMDTLITEVRFSGGGAKSRIWGQIIADCLGARVVVPDGAEFGAKGAALIAGVGVGWYASIQRAAVATSRPLAVYEPDPHIKLIYDGVYQNYRSIREGMYPLWNADKRPSA